MLVSSEMKLHSQRQHAGPPAFCGQVSVAEGRRISAIPIVVSCPKSDTLEISGLAVVRLSKKDVEIKDHDSPWVDFTESSIRPSKGASGDHVLGLWWPETLY
jgi:hypothetical protein